MEALRNRARLAYLASIGAAVALLCIGFALGRATGELRVSDNTSGNYEIETMSRCLDEGRKSLGIEKVQVGDLNDLVQYCYTLNRSQGLLNDFEIRRKVFFQQYYANTIMLWMVVAITVSGVLLAALQLAASYRLASAGGPTLEQSGEISLERGKIALKSSVTGLFIMVISFAFFLIFVLYVYQYREADVGQERSDGPPSARVLAPGAVGQPPPPTTQPR